MTPETTTRLGSRLVHRVGFGAMQLPGPGVFGPPRDRDAALAVLRRAVELGVDHIDTAQYYGPDVSNELIHAALHPYPADLALVSKVGYGRDERGRWLSANSPPELRAGVEANLRSLEVDKLAVVNLRVYEPTEPDAHFEDQLGAMIEMRDDGLIGGIGVSNVSLAQFQRATAVTEIVCVQNLFNVLDRSSAPVLAACEARGVAFVAFFPLGSGFATANQVIDAPEVAAAAARLNATPAQVALAWLLGYAPNILLIPGTSSVSHLEENVAAADLVIGDEDREALDALGA